MVPRARTNKGLSNFTCGLMCLARGPLTRLAMLRSPTADRDAARAPVQHTYPPLRDAVDALLTADPLAARLAALARPVTVLFGGENMPDVVDPTVEAAAHVTVAPLPSDLVLPPRTGDRLADLVLDPSAAGAPGWGRC